jgi:predicted permease
LLEQLASVPGITHAATGVTVPFVDDSGGAFMIEGVADQADRPSSAGRVHAVSPDYFAAMGIPVLRGRTFTDQDTATSEPVAVIDVNLAKQYWPNEDPIGKRIRRTLLNAPWTTIVGIVGHVKHSDLAEDSGMGSHYYPVYQTPQATTFTVLARTTLEAASLSNAIRDAVRAADPGQSVFELRTMEERVLGSLGTRRLAVQLMALFAGLGVFMAAIGLYGVVSYVVAQRTHEIGIRMALGAHRHQILALVVRHGMRMTFVGVALGSIGAFILAKSLSSQLFEVRPFDPSTFVLMAATVLMITLLACLIPARRATAVDPLDACRHD